MYVTWADLISLLALFVAVAMAAWTVANDINKK